MYEGTRNALLAAKLYPVKLRLFMMISRATKIYENKTIHV